jgi:hypothetical protein
MMGINLDHGQKVFASFFLLDVDTSLLAKQPANTGTRMRQQ